MIQSAPWWLFACLGPVFYWLAPARWRLVLLTLASLVVLMLIDPAGVAVMLALSLVAYGAFALEGSAVEARIPPLALAARLGRSAWMIVAIFVCLFVYKYLPALARTLEHSRNPSVIAAIVAPLGISYLTFKLAHYVIERQGKTLPPHGVREFLTWMFLMPTFTAGPIERFEHFIESRKVEFDIEMVVVGATRIARGLVNKFVLQNAVGWVARRLSGDDIIAFSHGSGGMHGAWAVWAYFLLDLIMVYLDFSAYSDIAIGAARLFGIRIMENFNYPLSATSLTEFWRRWHMTLTNWCRVYIFMPVLGVTRNIYLATIVCFFVIGLWHAASLQWVAWGLWNGVGLSLVIAWDAFAQKRRITVFRTRAGAVAGWAMTILWVTLGDGFMSTFPTGTLMDSCRLLARGFNVHL